MTKYLTVLLFSVIVNIATAQNIDIPGPPGSERFGSVTVLPNGNYVVVDAYYDEGAISNVGAVYLYNGSNHSVISILKGSTTDNMVGLNGIIALPNSSFLVQSWGWDNGVTSNVGAITWVNGTTGLSGVVSSSNSIVGSQDQDLSAALVNILTNGNYVISTYYWNNGAIPRAGAVTWGSCTSGVSGVVGPSISLVGTQSVESLGWNGVAVLTNGNYVLADAQWNGGVGAAVWCNGTTGRVGTISAATALTGSSAGHSVGGSVIALSNDNYVVASPGWDNGAVTNVGAITWCNGTTGTTGNVTTGNSFIGSKAGDQVGSYGMVALKNGNYVIRSPYYDNGAIVDAGAATWRNGAAASAGVISNANSLVGSSTNDNISYDVVTTLTNGNYVVASSLWDNGVATDAGAVTWGNGTTGTSGLVSTGNSLTGTASNDNIGFGWVTALTNGNYVVRSPRWDNGAVADAGAATWGNGTTGTAGNVSTANSLVGSIAGDNVGSNGIVALTNGNYTVASSLWDDGVVVDAGAVTWCNGTLPTAATVIGANSFVGGATNHNIGSYGVVALTNGNYVIRSPEWDDGTLTNAGAATWCDGITVSGVVSSANSLIGSSANDILGFTGITPFTNGNYIVRSSGWDNGATVNSGAVTFCNGAANTASTVTTCNSVLGTIASGGSQMVSAYNYIYDYLIVGRRSDNIVTIFDPTGMALANTLDQKTLNMNGAGTVPFIAGSGCRIIGTITPSGANPVSGSVTSKTWVESSVPVNVSYPFVARHYEVTPAANATTATARITLYFTQQEFTDFNNHPISGLDLPTGPSDAIGIANLRVGKFGGTSSDGSGLPGTYPGAEYIINPPDTDITWNNNFNRWEISFDVTGFSGFIVQTKTTALPLTLLQFNGHLKDNNGILGWTTTNEFNTLSFDIERSIDGQNYFAVGNIAAANQSGNNLYTYTDNNIAALGAPVVYYRLKQKDIGGRFTYSGIVVLSLDKDAGFVLFYPNPVSTNANLSVTSKKPEQVVLKIFDNTGRLLKQQQLSLSAGNQIIPVDTEMLASGVYYLEIKGQTINEHRSFVKQ